MKRKQEVYIADIIPYMLSSQVVGSYTITGSYDEQTITVFTKTDFIRELRELYYERKFLSDGYIDANDFESHESQFNNIFDIWETFNHDNIIRAYWALLQEYNPLDNYNGYEKIETTHGKTETTTRGTTDTRTLNLSDSLTNGSTVTTSTDVYGVNSTTAVPSDKTTAAHTGSDSTTHTGTDTLVRTGSDTVADTGTDTVETEKSGNLGVTTSQQMLTAEFDLRLRPFIRDIIHKFISEYTIY